MSPSSVITPAILDKFIGLLVPLFLAGVDNDMTTARHAAARMLAAYNTETEAQLSLAAEIAADSIPAPPLTVETLKLSEYTQTSVQDPMLGLSRQQRRAAQRKTDKRQRQQAEQARREAMRAARNPIALPQPVANPSLRPEQPAAA